MFDAVESHSQARADLAADGWRCGGADRPAQQQLTNTQVMQLVAELPLTSGNTLNRAMQLVAAGSVVQLLDHIGQVTGGSRGNNDVQRTAPGVKRCDGQSLRFGSHCSPLKQQPLRPLGQAQLQFHGHGRSGPCRNH